MAIVFTLGVSDQGVAQVKPDSQGNLSIHVDGNCAVLGSLDLRGAQAIPLVLYGEGISQPPLQFPGRPSLIFNQISDADSHRVALRHCENLCRQLSDIPVINPPEAVMNTRRSVTPGLVEDIQGLRVPRATEFHPRHPDDVFRTAQEQGFDYPFIVRQAGRHNARTLALLRNREQSGRLDALPLDGSSYYMIEFVDTADERGIYYKTRLVMVDGKPFVRHVFFGPNWLVNSGSWQFMKEHPELGNPAELAERARHELLPLAEPALKALSDKLGMAYFGIDCHIGEDGFITVFEANANMNLMGRVHKVFEPLAGPTRDALRGLIARYSGESLSGPRLN